ncbi:MAG: TolC family protein [Bacteroidales bacterium]
MNFIILLTCQTYSQNILTLDDALDTAINHSPEMIKSELSLVISKENLNARQAATKSNFQFQVTPIYYSQDRRYDTYNAVWNTEEMKSSLGELIISQPIVKTDATISLRNEFKYQDFYSENGGSNKGFSNDLYLTLSQPIFTYNRIQMELDRLKLDLENSTYNYSLQRLFLEKQVTQFFYSVYQSKMALKIAEEEYKNQQISFDIIKSKVDGGLAANAELLQAQLNLSNSESNYQNKKVELENDKDDFKQYIGLPLGTDFDIDANIDFKLVDVDSAKAVKNGLETRMELKQREISLKNSKYDLTVAESTNEFAGSVDLSLGVIGENENIANIYETPTRSPMFKVGFTIPIWDWGERKSRIKASKAMIEIEEINLENEKKTVEIAIRKSYRSLQNLALQVEIARQNEKNAQLTYEINLEKYRNGDLTSMDLGRYQNQLSTAKMNMANALISYKIELLNMKIQSLWDFENNINFVPEGLQHNINKKE